MARLKNEFYLIQNQETYDAIINWQLDETQDGDDFFKNITMSLDPGDLDGNGLPLASLSGKTPQIVMTSPYEVSSIQPTPLIDGRWVINKDSIHKWWKKMKRPYSQGGLKVSDGGTGYRNIYKDGRDIVPLGPEFYSAVVAMIDPGPTA